MFIPLNKLKRNNGQVAIILVFVIAVALIFYAVTLNLGKMSQTKTLVTIASNTGASLMASEMASLIQQMACTQLGCKKNVSSWTGVASTLFGAVLAIAGILLAPVSGGLSTTLIAVGAGLTAVSLAVQIAYIQPGLTNSWNKITGEILTQTDGFLEAGLRSALQATVTDQASVPDVSDFDQDRLWDVNGNSEDPVDSIGRFAFYYNELIQDIEPRDVSVVEQFVGALSGFVNVAGAGDWGLDDPARCTQETPQYCYSQASPSVPSQANLCCLPLTFTDPITQEVEPLRPDCCDSGGGQQDEEAENECGTVTTCGELSPYGETYPFVYNPVAQNEYNNEAGVKSFLEIIGQDDEHRHFYVDAQNPNAVPQRQRSSLPVTNPKFDPGFYLEDATGFWTTPPYTPVEDDRKDGVFSFFHKVADWGVDLNDIPGTDFSAEPEKCHWCDQDGPGCVPCNSDLRHGFGEIPQLTLPVDPVTLTNNTSYFVDGTNANKTGFPPVAADQVTLPANIVAAPNACGLDGLNGDSGFWKKGADQYCSLEWPYSENCGLDECSVRANDPLDDTMYGLSEFIVWARGIISRGQGATGIANLERTLKTWYDNNTGAGAWIETPSAKFILEDGQGGLYTWSEVLVKIRDRLVDWVDTSYAGGCDEVWCTPSGSCPLVQPDEEATFGEGKMEDVIACLDHNLANAARLQACYTACDTAASPDDYEDAIDACVNPNINKYLPRSLVADFDPTGDFEPPNPDAMTGIFADCTGGANSCAPCLDACDTTKTECDESCEDTHTSCVEGCGENEECVSDCGEALTTCSTTCNDNYTVCREDCYCNEGDAPIQCVSDSFAQDVQDAVAPHAGSCGDTAPGGYMDLLAQSIPEAQNQVVKFDARKNFLEGRLSEAAGIIDILDEAILRFGDFLDNAAALVEYRRNYDQQEGFPYQVIYGWKTEVAEGEPEGLWHLVRVDGRVPGRCDDSCGFNQISADPEWPKITTHTSWLGTRRTYELNETDGIVKMRVTRYDEPRRREGLLFPNGVPIWRFVFGQPGREIHESSNLGTTCSNAMVTTLPDGRPTDAFRDAFILNKRLEGLEACWDRVNLLLTEGVTSETCAQYYWHEGRSKGMGIRFVDCQAF